MGNATGNSAETPSPDITDLGHGVFQIDTRMAGYVRRKTLSRYAMSAADADPRVNEKFERISGAEANVGGIWHGLDRLEQPAS
jgi:hypothetical protein